PHTRPSIHLLISCPSPSLSSSYPRRPPPLSPLFPYATLFRSSVPLQPNQCWPQLASSPPKYKQPRQNMPKNMNRRQSPSDFTRRDRKSTRLNSSHVSISYAVFCLKKKTKTSM